MSFLQSLEAPDLKYNFLPLFYRILFEMEITITDLLTPLELFLLQSFEAKINLM